MRNTAIRKIRSNFDAVSARSPPSDDCGQAYTPPMAGQLSVGVQLPEVERDVRWPEIVSMARAAEASRFRLDLDRRPPALPGRRTTRTRAVGRVDDARGPRRVDRTRPPRPAGRLRCVPPARDPGPDGCVGRRGERRTVRARDRRRLERDGVPRVRHPVRGARLAVRGGVRGRPAPARGRARDVRGALRARRGRGAAARAGAARADDDRLERRPAAARRAPARRRLEHLVRRTTATRPRGSRR